MAQRIAIAFALLTTIAFADATDLSIELRANKRSARIGDRIAFTVIYTNTSKRDIGILPEYKVYAASELNFVGSSGEVAKRIPFGQANFDIDAIVNSFVVLKPGESRTRKISARVASKLPKHAPDEGAGLYVLFRGSAIKLPGPGSYKITTDYSAIEDNRTLLKNSDKLHYWVGKVGSRPVTIVFR